MLVLVKNFRLGSYMGKVVLKLYASKTERDSLALDPKGVLKDKYYDKDIDRSLLISSVFSYDLLLSKGIEVDYGALGENIIVNFNPYSLKIGQQLKIGDVIVEISQHCTICNYLSKIGEDVPKLLKDHRGIFAKVISGGNIEVGDIVEVI
jgi:MOSC domain-containing protein YiiM